MVRALCLFFALLQLAHQQDLQTVAETLRTLARSRSNPQYRAITTLLQSPCGSSLFTSLNNASASVTLFAPTDTAIEHFFPSPIPIRGWTCPNDAESCRENPSYVNKQDVQLDSVRVCISELLKYHVVPETQFQVLATLNNVPQVVTPLSTALNSTSPLVRTDYSQTLLVNQTRRSNDAVDAYVNYGARAAHIVQPSILCSNGVIHGIDTLLTPPTNISTTLAQLGMLQLATLVKSQLDKSTRNVTVFLPWKELLQPQDPEQVIVGSTAPPLNLSYYTTNGVYYNAMTATALGLKPPQTANVTSLAGTSFQIQFDRDYQMLVDGVNVSHTNILLDTGVLHILDARLPSAVQAQALQQA